jgi:hypothetical protein
MANQPKTLLTIRLRRALAETLSQMYQASRPTETKITLETYVMMLLETTIADFRARKFTPSPFEKPAALFPARWLIRPVEEAKPAPRGVEAGSDESLQPILFQ